MRRKNKKIYPSMYFIGIIISIVVLLSFNPIFNEIFAYQPPTANPPAGNLPVPINTSTSTQTKQGTLYVSSSLLVASQTLLSNLQSLNYVYGLGSSKRAYLAGL